MRTPHTLRRIVVACAVVSASCSQSSSGPTSPTAGSQFFNLTGSVRDSVLRPVSDARVEIADGPLASRFTTTDESGRFSFSDLTPATEAVNLRVTKGGYSPVTAPARNNRATIVTLTASALIPLEGEYQVTFIAANTCSGIPSDLRRRTYSAFYFGYDTLSGVVADDAVRLGVYSRYAFNN